MKASREIVLWTPTWDAWVGGVLAGRATLYAFFTVYAVGRRRATIKPFSLVWATMTFPSAITCIVWLQYAPSVYWLWAARAVAAVDLVFIFGVVVGFSIYMQVTRHDSLMKVDEQTMKTSAIYFFLHTFLFLICLYIYYMRSIFQIFQSTY